MKVNTRIMRIASVVLVLGLLLTFFLPLASANADYENAIESHAEKIAIPELSMSYSDIVDISMFDYARIYYVGMQKDSISLYGSMESVICFSLIICIAIFLFFCLIFAILKKEIPVIVFELLAFGSFRVLMWDMKDRGILPGTTYDLGIANIMYNLMFIMLLVVMVLMLVSKAVKKKRLKNSTGKEN